CAKKYSGSYFYGHYDYW
nr:immunoglobulin heavy chain junction region [Macaca mulatta]MOX58748.1 immunoglobulin heavy chain junction region [Macaca mulatta]MOX62250.1 immunoglobulin heavy chain junction region [Macaca mulatta]MOX62367.1 immunoglobulin heavy chain junction region [Macaca mulatta]MOX65762.1 immunoglobulin heavy chain junction region [Macaca mulatta]